MCVCVCMLLHSALRVFFFQFVGARAAWAGKYGDWFYFISNFEAAPSRLGGWSKVLAQFISYISSVCVCVCVRPYFFLGKSKKLNVISNLEGLIHFHMPTDRFGR